MKSLQEIRISLMAITAFLYFALNSSGYLTPAGLVLASNILLLLFCLFTRIADREDLKKSRIFKVIDILITSSYLLFLEPYWILGFSAVLAFSLVSEEDSRLLLYFLIILSVLAVVTRGIQLMDYQTLGLLLPTFVLIVLFLHFQEQESRRKKRDHSYLKMLVDNKNKLLSTLTHELRTPLSVIKTSNELVLEERPGPINETQKTLLKSSMENVVRLTSLVENILSQVKVEFAWFSMNRKVQDLRPLVRKVALDMGPFLETRKQTIRYNYPSLLSKVKIDGKWIQQVLLNLIHNGSKNSPEGSELVISIKENEQCVVLSVLDRGTGISNREISRVFNEFYQSDDPSVDLTEGAGLGLTIVKDIVEKHGGEVYITSIPRKGTTVSLTLPIHEGVLSGFFNTDN